MEKSFPPAFVVQVHQLSYLCHRKQMKTTNDMMTKKHYIPHFSLNISFLIPEVKTIAQDFLTIKQLYHLTIHRLSGKMTIFAHGYDLVLW